MFKTQNFFFLGGCVRKIFQETFLILRLNSERHSNKDYFENFLFLNPYVHRSEHIKYKYTKETNNAPPLHLQFSQMQPIIRQMPQGGVAQCHRNGDHTQVLRHAGKDLSTILQNVCVKHRWLNYYSQPLLHIQQLCGFFKNIQISTVKGIASAVAGRRISEGALTSEAENALVFEDSSDFLYFVLKHGLG